MIRVILPYHLRVLAQLGAEVQLDVTGPVTVRSILDALEARYPALCGTIRDHVTRERRPLLRFWACNVDISHDSPDTPLPDAIATGAEPFFIIGAIAGGQLKPDSNGEIPMRSILLLMLCAIAALALFTGTAWPQEEKKLPRVLIIGDSISLGYTEPVRKQLQGTAIVSRPKENCQHSAYGLTKIKTWLGNEKWDVIHFNFGIWDTHMLSENGALIKNEATFEGAMRIRHTPERYRENLVKLTEAMEKTGAKIIWASTTPIMSRTGKRFDDIKNLNTVAEGVMKERKIAINDLYAFVLPNAKEWQSGDKVHFNTVGNENLAKRVSASIREAMGKKAEKQ